MDLSIDSRGTFFLTLIVFVGVACLHGCSGREPAIPRPPRLIELPPSGELEVHALALAPVGDVLPIKLSVKNVAPRQRTFQEGVRAITDSGELVQELPLNDPSVVANGEGLLSEVSGGQSPAGDYLSGAACARRGVESCGWGWVLASGPLAWTVLGGMWAMKSAGSPSERLADYRLQVGTSSGEQRIPALELGTEYTGYVFFPNQHYAAIELTVLNTLTSNEEFIRAPVAFGVPTAHE